MRREALTLVNGTPQSCSSNLEGWAAGVLMNSMSFSRSAKVAILVVGGGMSWGEGCVPNGRCPPLRKEP